jgi:hypothetical protein
MNPTRSSSRLREAITGFICSIRLRRMRSATIGKNVSDVTVPSGAGSSGAVLRVWTSASRAERLSTTFPSKALSRSVTATKRSGAGGSDTGSDSGFSLTALARVFGAEAVLLVTVRLGVVGTDAVLGFVMYVLSCRNSAHYFSRKETTPSTTGTPLQQAGRIFEQFAEFANLPSTHR